MGAGKRFVNYILHIAFEIEIILLAMFKVLQTLQMFINSKIASEMPVPHSLGK